MSPPADDAWSYYLLVTGCSLRLSMPPHPFSLNLSVLINVSAVKKGGKRGGGTTSQYKVAFKISAPQKAIPLWSQQGWAALYQSVSRVLHTSRWICDGIVLPKTYLTVPVSALTFTSHLTRNWGFLRGRQGVDYHKVFLSVLHFVGKLCFKNNKKICKFQFYTQFVKAFSVYLKYSAAGKLDTNSRTCSSTQKMSFYIVTNENKKNNEPLFDKSDSSWTIY